MILINEDYKRQLQELHKEPKAFYRGLKVLGKIEKYLEKYQPTSLIDLGCGKGDLHKEFDYKRFASVLKTTNHKWLLTIDDSDRMRSFFKFANIQKLKIQYGMNNVKKTNAEIGNELLITNY